MERSFQAAWFQSWRWLHYDEMTDKAYCFYCTKGFKEKKLKVPNAEPAFVSDLESLCCIIFQVSKGFCNWKDETLSFRKHEQSLCHKEAVEMIVTLPPTVHNVDEMISQQHAMKKYKNCKVFLQILSSIRFLAH